MTTVSIGDKGSAVVELQKRLNTSLSPSPHLVEDGDFGAKTKEAVLQFQKKNGLVCDGIVGPQTWAKLMPTSDNPIPSTPLPSNAPWLKVAKGEIGTVENSRPGQDNSRIVEYHQSTTLKANNDEVPWCSSFVNWVVEKAGFRGTDSAAAMSWLDWGKTVAQKPGAITVIKKKGSGSDGSTGSTSGYHVGFLIEATPTYVRLLGGNQSDQVKYSNFNLGSYSVQGYRWPA